MLEARLPLRSQALRLSIALVFLGTAFAPLVGSAQAASAPAPLGMEISAISQLKAAGAAPHYGSIWVGDWMASSGWGGFDNAMTSAVAAGVTPVVYWYYWGDSISPSCVDNGCNGRSQAQWTSLTQQLADHVKSKMGGRETLIVLENEFNKNGITGSYAPTFDAKLETVAKTLKSVGGVKLILGFGNWGESSWTQFPKSAAQSDYIGFQMMRASTKDTDASYRSAADRTVALTDFVASKFNKPSFLYDLALSSYSGATWENTQKETLAAIFSGLTTSGATGLQGIVYRSYKDTQMSTANYYGVAESYWGLHRGDGSAKPAWDAWLAVATSAPASAASPAPASASVPATFEAESMRASTGGRTADSAASGGAAWNIWSNGQLTQAIATATAFTALVTIVAKGQAAGGVDAAMELRLDGSTVASFSVPPGYASYTARVAIPAGDSTLAVAFTNDAVVNGEDRNLLVDLVDVQAAPAPNAPPTAAFTSTVQDLDGAFDASASSDPEGAPLSYAWSFGDGATADGIRATHTFAATGTYDVTLSVSDGSGSASTMRSVSVVKPDAAPVASFTTDGKDLTFAVDASGSSDADGDALSYAWSFGDGATAAGMTASHAYAAPGDYTITLRVSDGKLSSDATSGAHAVAPNAPPTARMSASMTDLTGAFDGSASSDPEGSALTYVWSFGDGASATGAKATHAYATAGSYTVTLRVSDGELSDATGSQVTAVAPNRAPTARMGASMANLTGAFDGSASSDPEGSAHAYVWTFGDGASATGAKATHAYAAAGSYTVTLRVSDGSLSDTTTTVVKAVAPPPVAYSATFDTSAGGNEWWVQVGVASNLKTVAVCATVNDGACQALALKSYGWAASFHVPKGAKVVFTATSDSGKSITSGAYSWPTGAAYVPPFSATFSPYGGNSYWVQTLVNGTAPIKSVCASVNGGACQALTLKSWGAWAASFHVTAGSKVVFTAVATDGQKATSAAYAWPQ